MTDYSKENNNYAGHKYHVMRSRIIMAVGMLFADILSLTISILAAWGIRAWILGPLNLTGYENTLLFFYILFILTNFSFGLYEPVGKPREEKVRLLSTSVLFLGVGTAFIFFALKIGEARSRAFFNLVWIIQLFMSNIVRMVIRAQMTRKGLWGLPVAILTERYDQIPKAAKYLCSTPDTGLKPVLGYALEGQANHELNLHIDCPASLDEFKYDLGNDCFTALIVFDRSLGEMEEIRQEFRFCVPEIVAVGHKGERSEWRGVEFCQFGPYYGLKMDQPLLRRRGQIIKRAMDIIVCTLGMIIISPLFLLLMLLVKIDSRGPVFYRSPRRGKGGQPIEILKFRTMHTNGEEVLKEYFAKDPALEQEWRTYRKLKKDPRVTRIGRFLRKTSLDELPQLLDIITGSLSLVGPRPILLGDSEETYGPYLRYYDMVTPGLTGWWQINGRNETTFDEHAFLDYQYIMTWSVWKDIVILFATPAAMLHGETS